MKKITLSDLQESVRDNSAFGTLNDYFAICNTFFQVIQKEKPTRIVSPSQSNYIFYQYAPSYGHKITRPLNSHLFFETVTNFKDAFERFAAFLNDLKKHQDSAVRRKGKQNYIDSKEINKVVYTVQQSIGCIGDSFENSNQSRKRIGQLFENFIKLIIQEVGLDCEPRTINIPIPDYPGYEMSYELDLVFSRNKAIIASETKFIHPSEIVGSVKTTSKDRKGVS